MIVVPPEISLKFITENFVFGDIIQWQNFKGCKEVKDRFFVLATGVVDDEIIVFDVTSKREMYEKGGKRFNRDFILLKKDDVECLDKDTILDVGWNHPIPVKKMIELLGEVLYKKGSINDEAKKLLIDTIKNSKTLERNIKNKILENLPESLQIAVNTGKKQ